MCRCTFLGILLAVATMTQGYRILLFPLTKGFSSHLRNFLKVAEILTEAGHDVTILVNDRVLEHVQDAHGQILTFKVTEDIPLQIQEDLLSLTSFLGLRRQAQLNIGILHKLCDILFTQNDVLKHLQEQKFELIIADSWNLCNNELIRYLDVPSILYNSVGFFGQAEGLYPNIPSFMCVFSGWSCTRDDLTFIERVTNFLMTIIFTTVASFFREYKNNDIDGLVQIASEIDQSIVVINADFILEYPRPLMPHAFLISGLHIDAPKPLPTNFAKFMEDSAPHGLIVFSLGTQIDKCSADLAEVLGRVFGRLRQRVIWKHKGEPPSTLSNNTMITPWFPQNDILAHPLTKLFITHCGAQSTYEAAYHGVPVIAIPLMADQFGHASSLVHRAKMGLQLDLRDLQEETLETAIHEVLDNPMYKKNAKAVSELQADQLMPPRERFIHLVNYVIRHRGAKHLISKAAIRLNAFQFYSIDVIAFLLAIVTLIAVAVCCCMRHTCCRKPTSKHKRD